MTVQHFVGNSASDMNGSGYPLKRTRSALQRCELGKRRSFADFRATPLPGLVRLSGYPDERKCPGRRKKPVAASSNTALGASGSRQLKAVTPVVDLGSMHGRIDQGNLMDDDPVILDSARKHGVSDDDVTPLLVHRGRADPVVHRPVRLGRDRCQAARRRPAERHRLTDARMRLHHGNRRKRVPSPARTLSLI